MNQPLRQPNRPGARPPREGRPVAQWVPAAAAAGLLAIVVVAGVALGGGDGGDSSGPDERVPADSVAANEAGFVDTDLTVPDSVPEVTGTVPTSNPVVKTVLSRTLSRGLAGDDVKLVQERLTDLGFVPGPADGVYGDQTIKSVWAYEKLVLKTPSNAPTGQITPDMWDRMQDPFVIQPRRPDATTNHTEVYLPEQVLAVFHDDVPVMITHMASGTNEEWCEEVTISPGEYGNRDGEEEIKRGECGISNTPGGVFEFYRQVDGIRDSALGSMWNPMYFNYGIAIHGAQNVPLQPASHGCIRIPLNISESLQDLASIGDQIYVWDGVREPEEQSERQRLPTFNWIDPDYVGATTTTEPEVTTTVATTLPATTIPAVTVPAATQPAPVPVTAPPAPPTTRAPASTLPPIPAATAPPTTRPPATTVPPTTVRPTTTTSTTTTTTTTTTLAPG